MATGFGRALDALGAVPVAQPGLDPQNLTAAMLVVVPALLDRGNRSAGRLAPLAARDGAYASPSYRATPSRLARNRRADRGAEPIRSMIRRTVPASARDFCPGHRILSAHPVTDGSLPFATIIPRSHSGIIVL